MRKVVTLRAMDECGHKMLEADNCEIYTCTGTTEDEFYEQIKRENPDAIFCRTDKITKRLIDAAPNLKVVAKQGVGIDNIDVNYCTEKGIQVVYAPRGNSNAVAEHTILLMLMCAVRFRYVDIQMRRSNFDVRYTLHDTVELRGMTLGLLGCGGIGQMVGKIAADGFGMKVIGYDPFPPTMPLTHIDMMSRDDVLRNADFISLHMPSLPDTIHSIGYEQFCLMKHSGIFINCARGDIIVEQDLVRALNEGRFLGAGLDVFDQEPLSMESPLLQMEHVICTPHTAATTRQSVERCTTMACQSILEVLNGENVTYPANKLKRN